MKPADTFGISIPGLLTGTLLAAVLAGFTEPGHAQPPATEDMLQRHNFVFIAEGARPNAGPRHTLTPTYELRITSDSVEGRLPYYGRVYSASEASKTALDGFTIGSRLNHYALRKKRNGSWQLTVEVLSGSDVQKLTFDISGNGAAYLQINTAWRDVMFYDGRIAPAQRP